MCFRERLGEEWIRGEMGEDHVAARRGRSGQAPSERARWWESVCVRGARHLATHHCGIVSVWIMWTCAPPLGRSFGKGAGALASPMH